MNGERPARPQGAQELGLTDPVWEMVVRCWSQDPAQRPTITEATRPLYESLVSSLSIEADLNDFFQACKAQDKDDHGEKAQQFTDRLDEVRHTKRHNFRPSYHTSRSLAMQILINGNGNDI